MAALPRRPAAKPSPGGSASGQQDFPVVFTIEGSARHEVILVNPGHELEQLRGKIEALNQSSPNCAEFMSKYRSKESRETVDAVKVKWAMDGRDKQLFPKETLLTEENCEAVLRLLAVGGGRDVLDVKLKVEKTQAGGEGEGEGDKKAPAAEGKGKAEKGKVETKAPEKGKAEVKAPEKGKAERKAPEKGKAEAKAPEKGSPVGKSKPVEGNGKDAAAKGKPEEKAGEKAAPVEVKGKDEAAKAKPEEKAVDKKTPEKTTPVKGGAKK